jgi:peptidoglycan/xylan/chitin deacetylase (PgdA/CDA1 family)
MAKAIGDGRSLPDHAVAITFDDGYLNNLEFAVPLLLKYGMPATFFLTTGFIDGTHAPWWYRLRACVSDTAAIPARELQMKEMPAVDREQRLTALGAPAAVDFYPMMSWTHVNALHKSGFEIGAHTVSHVSLGREEEPVVVSEIAGSIQRIAEMTGVKPALFAYPYGRAIDISDHALACLRGQGCIGAVTTTQGMNRPGDHVLRLKRFNVTGNHSAGAFSALVSGLHAV